VAAVMAGLGAIDDGEVRSCLFLFPVCFFFLLSFLP
jgi:hypothetical protein